MLQLEHIDKSLARGATRSALRGLAARDPGRRESLKRFAIANPMSARRNEKARRRWIAKLPKPALFRLVANADATEVAWIEALTALPQPNDPWSGVQLARVTLQVRPGGAPMDVQPICFIDQHVLMRIAQRAGDLNVAAYPADIAKQTLGWIQAANEVGAARIAVPYRDGILYGRRVSDCAVMTTYIGYAQLSNYRRDALERLREDLPPLPRMPRLGLLPEDLCQRVAEAMARACDRSGAR
ncbi:MAG: hypothetical protein DI556_13110 [Rhodovulum sulfidophilum]|uniref:Uncharacterized protein n=1 Tax=Rhodovulum sulfidophilum TaxID=35806 RepID=A0A2W5N5H9_RHOSU|nr:MAG: hypothetical protein DI556_13110 [Rhodovulum sulfidophilum]